MIGATRVIWSRPMKAATSGRAPGRSRAKRCAMQPATISFCPWRRLRRPRCACASRMWPIDSSFDESMNEQVLTMTTSACAASGTTCMPAWCRWPTMISLSTRFLAQPREMRLTLIIAERGRWYGPKKKPRQGAAARRRRLPSSFGGLGGPGLPGALLPAFFVGQVALSFDYFVVLLAHEMKSGRDRMFPSGLCESSTAQGRVHPDGYRAAECQTASSWPS